MNHRAMRSVLSFAALCLLPAQGPGPAVAGDPEAERLMREAHVARSRWDETFPGFEARLQATLDEQAARGTVRVSAAGEVTLDLPESPAAAWARAQLESIAMHRLAPVEEHYDVSFADEALTHPLGRLIKFHGGQTHSLYRIQGDLITEVHRSLANTRFTISVTDAVRNAEGKTLPRHFNVSYWDPQSGALTANHDFHDEWVHVGAYDLPVRRLMIKTSGEGRQVYELRLDEHRLAAAEAGGR